MSVPARSHEHEEVTVTPPKVLPREGRPAIQGELYEALTQRGQSLVDLTWEQQRLHESRRWSVVEMLAQVDFTHVREADRHLVWNAGRAELTTKPGADRLERLADLECRRWQEKDATVAAIMQACGTWSRYWNEEEAHHETAFNRLSTVLRLEPVSDATFIEFRKVFPDDDMLRTL
ncbi:MAG: ferritin-like domain-containing protein, partial [Myxococcaceae bacterium]